MYHELSTTVSKAKSKEEGVFSPLPPFWYSAPVSLTWRKSKIHQVSTDAVVLASNEGFPFGLNVLLKEILKVEIGTKFALSVNCSRHQKATASTGISVVQQVASTPPKSGGGSQAHVQSDRFPVFTLERREREKAEERRKYEKENGEPWGMGGRKRRKERNFFSFPRMFFAAV